MAWFTRFSTAHEASPSFLLELVSELFPVCAAHDEALDEAKSAQSSERAGGYRTFFDCTERKRILRKPNVFLMM